MSNEAILQRVLSAIEKEGLSAAAASKLVDGKPDLIRNWQRDSKILPRLDTLAALANVLHVPPSWLAFGDGGGNDVGSSLSTFERTTSAALPRSTSALPLAGTVSGGVWRDVDSFDQDEKPASPFLPDPRWPSDRQFALRVEGESINRVARDGDLIAVVAIEALETPPANGALVIVEEARDDGALIRTTAKRLHSRGKLAELHADSDDPRWRDVRLVIEPDTGDARLITTRIVGLVTAVHRALA